jgi:hypothetical protein
VSAAEGATRSPIRLWVAPGTEVWTPARGFLASRLAAVSGIEPAIQPTQSLIDRLRASGAGRSVRRLRAFFTAGRAGAFSRERRNALPGYARYAANLAYFPAGGMGLQYQLAAWVGLRGDVTLLIDPDKHFIDPGTHFAPRYGVSVVVPLGSR